MKTPVIPPDLAPLFAKLDNKKAQLDSYRPLPAEVVANLHDDLVLKWIYHSNAIEGNTLTLKETKVALEGITIGGKSLREHFEVINHQEAIAFVEEMVKTNQPLTEWHIKALHQLVLKNVDDDNAGRYRHVNVLIAGAEHRPPESMLVAPAMQDFITWYNTDAQLMHPVERSARIHADFVKIHPFVDGNGRTSRLLMNLELLKAGFPIALIRVEERLRYYEALDNAHVSGDYADFIALVANTTLQGFEPYWWALGLNSED